VSSLSQSNLRINATFVENKCNFLTFLLQQKLSLIITFLFRILQEQLNDEKPPSICGKAKAVPQAEKIKQDGGDQQKSTLQKLFRAAQNNFSESL